MTDLDLIDRMPPWVTPAIAARITKVSHWTIRSWMRRGKVGTMCAPRGDVLVYWPDVDDRKHADVREVARV